MKVGACILLAIIACVNAASHELTCEPAEFTDPSKINTAEPVCKTIVANAKTAKAEQLTGDFDVDSIPSLGSDRKGKELFDELLAQKQPSTDELMEYAQALGMVALPAVAFLVLNFCCCFCCTCCHTCCKCGPCKSSCGLLKCYPTSERPYGKCETISPVIVWLLCSLLMFSFAIAGVVQGVYKMNDTVVNSVCLMDNTYLRFNAFLNNVKTPLDKLKGDFEKSVSELKDAAVQDPQLSENVRNIGRAFDAVRVQAEYNKKQVADNAIHKSACDSAWDKMIKECDTAKETTDKSANEVDKTLIDIQNQIQSSVVDASADATEALATGSDTIADTMKKVDEIMNPRTLGGSNALDFAELVRDNRDNGAFSFYGWVFIAIVFGLGAIVGMRLCREEIYLEDEYPTNGVQGDVIQLKGLGKCCACFGCCSWFMVLAFGISCAFLATLFLLINAVGSDACLVIPSLPQKLGELTGQDQISQITDTCWNKTGNLFEGLKLDEEIKLDGINFDDFKDSFGGDGVELDKKPVDDLKALVEDENNLQDICFGTKISPSNQMHELRRKTLNAIDLIKANMTFAEKAFNDNPAVEKLITSGEKVINTVKCAINDFKRGTGCYFLAQTWEEAVNVLCKGFLGSLNWIGVSELMLAIMAIPYAITLMFVMKREAGHGPIVATSITKQAAYGTEVDAVEIEMHPKY